MVKYCSINQCCQEAIINIHITVNILDKDPIIEDIFQFENFLRLHWFYIFLLQSQFIENKMYALH